MSIKLAFIGAGSTIFMKNVVGDLLTFPALASAEIALMDIDAARLDESRLVAEILVRDAGTKARVTTHLTLNPALDGADFVVTAFQVGGYDPATIIDFKLPKAAGLDQTIGDTLGVAGIMRALRTVPELFRVALAMQRLCPDAWLMNYVNPMVMNCWALSEAFPDLNVMGLCHSVQNTVMELAHDLDMAPEDLRYRVAGVNHVAFFLDLTDTQGRDLYPALRQGYGEGRLPKPPLLMPRCPNKVRYEVMKHFGYFCTESSEHLAEYTPWFIKRDRPDLIENFGIPLEEAIEDMAERIPNMDLRFFATAIILQRTTGGDLSEILDKIGHLVRERLQILGQIQALTGEGRMSGAVLLALPPVLFVVMLKLNYEYVIMLFTDPIGHYMLAGGLVTQIIGALVIKKIIDIKV